MYRLLTILISFLFTAHAMRASVAIPYVFVKNYTVDDYKASCQNWGFSLTPDGMLYVANNSGLLAFDGNTWKLYSLPGQEEVTGVTNYNDTIYTRNETMLGSWTYDKDGILRYHPLDTVPPEIRFTPPPVEIPLLYRKKYRMHSRVPSLPTERSFSSEPSHKDYISQTPTVRSCNTCLYRTNYKTISSALSAYRTPGKSGWRSTTDYHKFLSILRSLC